MSERDKSGSTVRQQLESVWRQTGKKPKELEEVVSLPESCYKVWKIFIELNNKRSSNGFGVNPISYQEMHAYCQLHGTELELWEITVINKFDSVVLDLYSKKQEAEQRKAQKKK